VLSEMLGIADFETRVAGLSRLNLVQEGAELSYLLRGSGPRCRDRYPRCECHTRPCAASDAG